MRAEASRGGSDGIFAISQYFTTGPTLGQEGMIAATSRILDLNAEEDSTSAFHGSSSFSYLGDLEINIFSAAI